MQVLAFGDSFVKMFIHCRPAARFIKFKGKSMKGIVKENDEEHERVQKQIKKFPKVKNIIFMFGQVDFNYVRYYKLVEEEPQITEEVFRDYVKWVSSMNKNRNISIVSIFPSPVKQDHIISSLSSKLSYRFEKQCPQNDQKILCQYKKSKETWEKWNGWIAKHCQIYKVKNICLFNNYEVPEEFVDLSNLNIHLRYVPVLKRMSKHINIKFDEKKAEEIEKQYEEDKVIRIQQSINRMIVQRQQASETTTDKQENKQSISQQQESHSCPSSSKQKKQIKSAGSDSENSLKDYQIYKPPRKKTVEVFSYENSQQKTEKKQNVEVPHKDAKQQQKNESDSDESSDDAAQLFYQMAVGKNNSKY